MNKSTEYQSDLDTIRGLIAKVMHRDNEATILGPVLTAFREEAKTTSLFVASLALLNDFARVSEASIRADGTVTEEEKSLVTPLFAEFAASMAKVRHDAYGRFVRLDKPMLPRFLINYKRDGGMFGLDCEQTHWAGLDVCCRAAQISGEPELMDLYIQAQVRQMDRLFDQGGTSDKETAVRAELKRVMEDRVETNRGSSNEDKRVMAFCNPNAPSVFTAVAHSHQVWERDPFDVPTVHRHARDVFERLVEHAISPGREEAGRILVLRGDSGAGKTHLMRAFRAHVHGRQSGYVAYMQMTSRGEDYARYVLANVIDSLQKPYDLPDVEESGLMHLSNAIAEHKVIRGDELTALREAEFDLTQDDPVSPLVDKLLDTPEYGDFDPDLLRVFLYLQRREAKIRGRVMKYLRCEPLNPYDRRLLGEIVPPTDRDAAMRTVRHLGRLMSRSDGRAIVFLVDQLEDIFHVADAEAQIPRTFDVLRQMVESLPNLVIVVACLRDLYQQVRERLAAPLRDRLDRDPAPITLKQQRSFDDIQEIVSIRLQNLYETQDVIYRPGEPTFPFTQVALEKLTNLRTRDLLEWCRSYQEKCIEAGDLIDEEAVGQPGTIQTDEMVTGLEQAWNDFRAQFNEEVPDGDDKLASLLANAATAIECEFDPPLRLNAKTHGEGLTFTEPGGAPAWLGLCNKYPTQLARQLADFRKKAGGRRTVLVRCSEYPNSPRSKVVTELGNLLKAGARRLTIDDADWRTMAAFGAFEAKEGGGAGFAKWRKEQRPLSQMQSLRSAFALDKRPMRHPTDELKPVPSSASFVHPSTKIPTASAQPSTAQAPPTPNTVSTPSPPTGATQAPAKNELDQPEDKPVTPSSTGKDLRVGRTGGLTPEPLSIELESLTTHAAFLGSTKSGKTTLALHLIEQLLERRIPCLMVDRKGDLCTYAKDEWWGSPSRNAGDDARKKALRERVNVSVYTPGEPEGHNLRIPFAPVGLKDMKSHERQVAAQQAGAAIAAMLGYKENASDAARLGVLVKAIEVLGSISNQSPTLERVVDLIYTEDAALINAIGRLDTKHFSRLVDHLETLRINKGAFLEGAGEMLDPAKLLGVDRNDGKVELGIISTKFLRDNSTVEFWVSRLLAELARWASGNPSKTLQAIVMFDEADIYMPAQSKPATKEPMQDLLRRARSAGLGVFLATQSPGDLDYRSRDNIRTWFVGRVTGDTAIKKMQPLLSECKSSVKAKIARQTVGEFHMLQEGLAVELKSDRSIMDTEQLGEDEIRDVARKVAQRRG